MPKNIYEKIRTMRKAKGLSLKDLSEGTGLSQSFISQVERGKCDMTLMSMVRIAKALDVNAKEFFEIEHDQVKREVTAAREQQVEEGQSVGEMIKNSPEGEARKDYRLYKKISSDFPGKQLDAVIVVCEPHSETEVMAHDGEEFIFILEGAAHIRIGEETVFVKKGESVHFPSKILHGLSNRQDIELKYLIVVTELLY